MEFNELGVQISLTSYYFQIFRPCEIKPDLPAKKKILTNFISLGNHAFCFTGNKIMLLLELIAHI